MIEAIWEKVRGPVNNVCGVCGGVHGMCRCGPTLPVARYVEALEDEVRRLSRIAERRRRELCTLRKKEQE